jgi:hypothetical protein
VGGNNLAIDGSGIQEGVPGVIGTAYSWPSTQGSGNCLQYTGSSGTSLFSGLSQMTLSTWVNIPASIGNTRTWVFYAGGASSSLPNDLFTFTTTGGNFYMAGQTGGDYEFPLSSIPLSSWNLVTFTWTASSSTGMRFYLNGVQQGAAGSSNGALPAQNSWPFIGGVTTSGNWMGSLDDVAAWNQALGAADAKALYTAPTTFTTDAAAGHYGAGDMQSLFNLYAAQTGSVAINGKTWQYSTTGFNQTAGSAWSSGGVYYLQLGTSDGVSTGAVPEPSTLALLAAGLAALLAYAWRKRR